MDFGQDGRTENGGWVKGAKGLRTEGQKSILESMGSVSKEVERPAKRLKTGTDQPKPTKVVNAFMPFTREDGRIRETSWTSHESSPSHVLSPIGPQTSPPEPTLVPDEEQEEAKQDEKPCPQILTNVTIYINGSTMPAISDHKLKHLISIHGGRMSIALGRRTVTHVIIGRPNSNGGCGGGLSGSKTHKEVTRMGGVAVKYVTAEWVLESIKAGKRLPESRFEAMRLAPKGVNSIAGMFGGGRKTAGGEAKGKEVG